MSWGRTLAATAALVAALGAMSAQAQDKFKIAIGQLEIWSGQAP
jgi:hypothetical protein